jgi:hypothetical protein
MDGEKKAFSKRTSVVEPDALVRARTPDHKVLRVRLSRAGRVEPSFGEEGVGLGVDLLVMEGGPHGGDEHSAFGDGVLGGDGELFERHVGDLGEGKREGGRVKDVEGEGEEDKVGGRRVG